MNAGLYRDGLLVPDRQIETGRFFLNQVLGSRRVDDAYFANAGGVFDRDGVKQGGFGSDILG